MQQEFKYLNIAIKTIPKFNVYGADSLNTMRKIALEFDASSTDIAHTQRIGGTVNPKEAYGGSFAEEIVDFDNSELLDAAYVEWLDVLKSTYFTNTVAEDIENIVFRQINQFKENYKIKTEMDTECHKAQNLSIYDPYA